MINAIINKIIKVYLAITIVLTVCGRIIPVKNFIGNDIESILYMILAGVGGILLLLDLFTTRTWYKGKYVFVLYAFIGVMCISSVLNIQYGFVDNVKTIIWTAIQFGLIYTAYLRYTKNEMFRFLDKIWIGISTAWFFPVCYSIWQFISLQGYRIEVSGGGEVRQGFIEHRLFGVFNDPNYAAIMSLGVIFACIYLCNKFSNRYLKLFFYTNIVVQTIYISLSGSRTAMLVFMAVSIVFLWLKVFQKKDQYKKIVKAGVAVLIPVVIISGTFALDFVIQKVAVVLPQTYSHIVPSKNGDKDNSDSEISDTLLERTDTESISNNRGTIWKSYIEGMDGDWLLGGSPRNFLEKWIEKDPDGYLAKTNYETHNGYLLVLVATGVVGFLVMLLFAILCIRNLFKYIKKEQQYENEFLFSIVFIVLNAAYMFFFTEVFFIHNYTSVLFWLYCGILQYWIADDTDKKRIKSRLTPQDTTLHE